jgi:hypothetical protein
MPGAEPKQQVNLKAEVWSAHMGQAQNLTQNSRVANQPDGNGLLEIQ